jgi:glycosyltransferase involved in cell wall biosynthesis
MKNIKMLRLLYIAQDVSLFVNRGDTTHVKEVVEAFIRRGLNITLLIGSKERSKSLENYICTLKLPRRGFPVSILAYVRNMLTITLAILILKPDIIYVRANAINLEVIIGKILHIPVILEVNGDVILEYGLNKILVQIIKLALRITYYLADAIIVPTKGLASLILQREKVNPNKIYIIPNAVNIKRFYPRDKTECRQKLKLSEDYFYFCFVGNLAKWQGLDYAITALAQLLKEDRNQRIKLIIVGDGPEKEKLIKLANKLQVNYNIIFLGSVNYKEIPYIINACDVCIAPFTSWRNKELGISPLKLYEYLACGKPVITSKLPGTEIVSELDAGILVEAENIEKLKEAYKEVLKRLHHYNEKRNIIHEEIAKNHSWDNRVDIILNIIQQIIYQLRYK